ncbi:(d)CMP kinase [Carnobacterium maltaromaticum]|uniref:Cytidylate kinase n=1 Tax=Carnobacterium maltaromaticum TaxID=2751 RepID=A0AAW9K8D0_CARML|nr:(d)CMP kinase [Carnobacterium maltaromaticum]KRN87674.1 cytidylate kinase [Carnobacterium maltaromaticum]MDT1944784.1 (d)CMP kinase [Carnobacterium maltaromaticum]MDT1998433.1 (d)CMP kinase [Carnobacterium maltaromaticum]MDW5522557.1 (d)CMP kinase [Carnobacterium maltaromaticum]MDZ5760439.1 (d)CMP kinase [Carnobacterium maltaromaticum]
MTEKRLRIAIDGPASAGKSTVAKILAKDLGYIYCDTGAMYRALTYMAMENNISVDDEAGLVQLLQDMTITFDPSAEIQKVFVNGKEVTDEIRQSDVTNGVSAVSAHQAVRVELVKRQQEIAKAGGIVMDGRDIGTAVLPDAEIKIFLVASVTERAERRFKENQTKGITTALEVLQQEIADRDYKDSTRKVSPLLQAEDAILVDTTSLSIEGVVAKIKSIIEETVKK